MKKYKIIHPLLLILVSLSMIQCNEENMPANFGKEITFGDPLSNGPYAVNIENVTITPELLSLKISWNPVADEELAYYELEWQGSNPDQPQYNIDTMRYTAQTKDTTYTISQLYNEIYNIKIKAVSKKMTKSEPFTSRVSPTFDLVPPSGFYMTKAVEMAQSLILGWNNPSDEDFAGVWVLMAKRGTNDWTISQRSSVEETEMIVTGLTAQTEYDIKILPLDKVGNYNPEEIVIADIKTKSQVKLKNMKIFRFYCQDTISEGSNGRARQIIDGDFNTYYHSTWKEGNLWWNAAIGAYEPTDIWYRGRIDYFPQWIIIDLGAEVIPTRITVWPRQTDSYGAIRTIELEASTDDLYTKDPDKNEVFLPQNNLGTYDMGETTKNKKPYTCEIANIVAGTRFIRVNFKAAWDDQLVRVAEIEIEAMVNE